MRHTDETKALLSEMRRGERNPFFGRKHSDETKRRIGERTRINNRTRRYEPLPQRIVIPDCETIAYVAGLVDADGSIRFAKKRPFAAIYNTNVDLIDWLCATFGAGNLSKGNLGRERVVCWRLDRALDVYAFVSAIRPRLIVKAADADAALAHLRAKYELGAEEVTANG